jgi:BirA family transcriptional regulator, biotin operon repressor / biotin---[acetyl-CoA-carboxylase] ligase
MTPLAALLQSTWPGATLQHVAQTGSTNADLLDQLRAGPEPDAPLLRMADRQTAGRGRLGRSWQGGEAGASLAFSLAVRPVAADWSGLSLAVGLAVAEALDPAGARLALKWPNDVWLRDGDGGGDAVGRKLAGVLVESLPVGGRRWAVIGIGINLRPSSVQGLPGAACWAEVAPQADAPAVLAALLPRLAEVLAVFDAQGFAPLAPRFAARDGLAGRAVVTTDPSCPSGTAHGVAPDGTLRIVRPDGSVHPLHAGEVSVRPEGQPLPAAPGR